MEKELWVVYFESANYCGYGEHCLVWATSEKDAKYAASSYAEEQCMQQDSDQYKEEYGDNEDDEDCLQGVLWANVQTAFALSSEEGEDVRGYLLDDTQKQFYPIVN